MDVVEEAWVKEEIRKQIKEEVQNSVQHYFQEHDLGELIRTCIVSNKPMAFGGIFEGDDGK